ncbi:MAG: GTP-binding protein [Thermoplasmata archaeon]|nr:MAG: GTP-binding protein [Thermoplasmata archaeon]
MKIIRKICMLGDPAVGKTSLVRRFVYSTFDDKYISTIGTKIVKKDVNVQGNNLTLLIWDILGQNATPLHSVYYKGASGALVVADVTVEQSITNIPRWIDGFRKIAGNAPVVIVGNKIDLKRVDEDYLAKLCGCSHPIVLTSAKTGEGVERAFTEISKLIIGGG